MKRLAAPAIVLGMALAGAGCGSNPQEEEVTRALGFFQNAADRTRALKNEVEKVVKQAEKNPDKNAQLTEKDFKPAEDAAKTLREIGKQLLDVKGNIDLLQEHTTPQQKDRLAERFRDQLTEVLRSLDKAQKDLDAELVKASRYARDSAMEHLRKTIRDSREEFYILTRPR